MVRRSFRLPAYAAAMAISLAGSHLPAAAKDTLVTAFQGSVGSPINSCHIEKIAKGISGITGLKPELHAGSSGFGNPKKLYTQLALGITDLSIVPLAYSPDRFPVAEIVSLPFIDDDYKAITIAANKLIPRYLAEELRGTKPLALMALPPYQIHLRKPVENVVTGLKGKRIRVVGKGLISMFRALGADIVSVPVVEVYEDMQNGVVDGFVLPNAPLAIFKQHEVSDYHVQANLAVAILYIGLSKKFWDSLSADRQRRIDARFGGPEAAVRYVSCFDKLSQTALNLAAKGGGIIRSISAEETVALEQIARRVVDAYLDELEERGKPARAFLKDLQTGIAAAKQ